MKYGYRFAQKLQGTEILVDTEEELQDMIQLHPSPNVAEGRETHTYLTYILEHYDNLPEWVVFTQGVPAQHAPAWRSVFK